MFSGRYKKSQAEQTFLFMPESYGLISLCKLFLDYARFLSAELLLLEQNFFILYHLTHVDKRITHSS